MPFSTPFLNIEISELKRNIFPFRLKCKKSSRAILCKRIELRASILNESTDETDLKVNTSQKKRT